MNFIVIVDVQDLKADIFLGPVLSPRVKLEQCLRGE